jgi:hypothetical protein
MGINIRVHHQESLTVHTASSFCVCVYLWHCLVTSYKTVPQPDTTTETGGCMYGEGLLMMSAWRSKHVELYTYRQKIEIYHKLHLLVYLLENMKMHGPGNIKFIHVYSSLGIACNKIRPTTTNLIKNWNLQPKDSSAFAVSLLTLLYCHHSIQMSLLTLVYCHHSIELSILTLLYCQHSIQFLILTLFYCHHSIQMSVLTLLYCQHSIQLSLLALLYCHHSIQMTILTLLYCQHSTKMLILALLYCHHSIQMTILTLIYCHQSTKMLILALLYWQLSIQMSILTLPPQYTNVNTDTATTVYKCPYWH